MQKWEYMIVECVRGWKGGLPPHESTDWTKWQIAPGIDAKIITPLIDYINQLGTLGWELVSVNQRTDYQGEHMGGFTTSESWVFKRPKAG